MDPLPVPESLIPDSVEIRSRTALWSVLRRIDGWGALAWREVLGAWRLTGCEVVISALDGDDGPEDEDERRLVLILRDWSVTHRVTTADAGVADADWALRRARAVLLAKPAILVRMLDPGAGVRSTTAAYIDNGCMCICMHVFLPYAGMGIDSQRMRRFLRQVDRLAADLQAAPAGELRRHRTTLMRQRALRAALAPAGLCAFLADGAILARDAGGGPDFRATPLATPAALRRTIDLGRFGRVTGWGIPMGVTALVGAPYHGKSTVLAAIQAGIEDHPPGDGRELVVADVSAVLVQAEDGRRIKDQDTRAFFAALPGADPAHLTTARASGATSMASSILQAVAAGCRLLLIDEDTAAGNVLHVDPVMRKLLGRTFRGTTTIGELLPGLAAAGVSTVMVVGSTGHLLADAGAVVQLDHWQPHDVTRLVRRLVRRHPGRPCSIPSRVLADTPEALQGPRAFVACDLRDVERPRIRLPDGSWTTIDLRRCGWHLDAGVVAGAIAAAGWLCRLAGGVPRPMSMVAADFAHLVARGPTALDPFHGRPLAVPPWQLVVSVLERLPVPWITNEVSESRNGRPPAPLV